MEQPPAGGQSEGQNANESPGSGQSSSPPQAPQPPGYPPPGYPPPGYPPPGYAPPGYPQYPPGLYAPAPTKTNGFAVASLVLGIVGILFPIGLILAVVFGFVGKGQINRSNGTQRGRGLAIAGLVLGLGFLALYVLAAVLILAAS